VTESKAIDGVPVYSFDKHTSFFKPVSMSVAFSKAISRPICQSNSRPNLSPTSEKQTVAARRRPNTEYRTREYLTEHEVEQLIEAAKGNRQGHRDGTMILLAFRHGLRAAEVCDLRGGQVEVDIAALHVRRRKNGTPSVHPL